MEGQPMKIVLAALLSAGVVALAANTARAEPPVSPFPAHLSEDTFERATETPLSNESKWSKLAWAKSSGEVFSHFWGWTPAKGGQGASESGAEGAYWNLGEYSAPAVSVQIFPEKRSDYVALWADTTGTGSKNGYRLKVEGSNTEGSDGKPTFNLILEKWVGGDRTILGEAPKVRFEAFNYPNDKANTVGLTVVNKAVTAWFGKHETELAPVIEATDPGTPFTKGYTGVEGTGGGAFGESKFHTGSPTVHFYHDLSKKTAEPAKVLGPGEYFRPSEEVAALFGDFGPHEAFHSRTSLQTVKGETSHYVSCSKLDSDWKFVEPREGAGTAIWKIDSWTPSDCQQVGYCKTGEAVGLELKPLHVEIDTYLGTKGYRYSHFRPTFTVTCNKKPVANIVMSRKLNSGELAAYWSNGSYSRTEGPPNLELEDGPEYSAKYGAGGDMELEGSGGQEVIQPDLYWFYLGYERFPEWVIPSQSP
jgi:hypothetical protein